MIPPRKFTISKCACGSEMDLLDTCYGVDNVVCPRCGKGYYVPLEKEFFPPPSDIFIPGGSYDPKKEYKCKICKAAIPEGQATRTFQELERALCGHCEFNEQQIKR